MRKLFRNNLFSYTNTKHLSHSVIIKQVGLGGVYQILSTSTWITPQKLTAVCLKLQCSSVQIRCFNLQYVKSNSTATLERKKSDSARFSFFNKQQTGHIHGKIIQFDVALQNNASRYTRIAVIADKHVKSRFAPTATETSEEFLNISIIRWSSLISVHYLTFNELTIRLTE